jgi:hypothetical protein
VIQRAAVVLARTRHCHRNGDQVSLLTFALVSDRGSAARVILAGVTCLLVMGDGGEAEVDAERGGSQESPDGAARPRAAAPPGPQMPAQRAPALDRSARRPAPRELAALLCAARIHQEVGIGQPNG